MTAFGRARLPDWPLDSGIVYLNHGTVGVPPRRVLAAQQRLRDEIERSPSRFMLRELTGHGFLPGGQKPRLRAAADIVAPFLGARSDDVVFVDNATTGVNAVLRSFAFQPGDEILITDLVYGAVGKAAAWAAGSRGASVRRVELPHPLTDPAQVVDAIDASLGPHTRMAIVDHITSETALVFPVAEVARRCHAQGVPVLVDGAHAPGAIPLDIPALGVDWYVGNLHKWCWSPRSCAILWADPSWQPTVKPTTISWGDGEGFVREFDWNATKDPTPALAAPEGIAAMQDIGVDAIRRYNHQLAWEGAHALCERWGTTFVAPESMIGTMATLPLPARAGSTGEQAVALRAALLYEDRIEVAMHAAQGRIWARISAQIYNDMRDVDALGEACEARWGAAAR